jgi:hypothetical protein
MGKCSHGVAPQLSIIIPIIVAIILFPRGCLRWGLLLVKTFEPLLATVL